MDIYEAKNKVISSGLRLQATGLIARTWGNISCRVDLNHFVITPSGKGYEGLSEEDIVMIRLSDESFEGNVKPSSERGVHAALYKLHPDINFIIHTHQLYATAVGVTGEALSGLEDLNSTILGPSVPCAKYGLSTTKPLRDNVEAAARENPSSRAILMRNHGAVCMGTDMEDCFLVCETLEELARERFSEITGESTPYRVFLPDSSSGKRYIDYRERNGAVYAFLKTPAVKYASSHMNGLPAYIDDMAQLCGPGIPLLPRGSGVKRIDMHLAKRPAVFIKDRGAICMGENKEEADALAMVLDKNACAAIVREKTGKGASVPLFTALLENYNYKKSYSKLK